MTDEQKNPRRPCPRCGVPRQARKSAMLCRDCYSTLTKTQRQAWAA